MIIGSLLILVYEILAISQSTFLLALISVIKDPETNSGKSALYVCIFFLISISYVLIKNYGMLYGQTASLLFRKTIISAMYEKVSKLSVKSLTETNSGKLIALVSGDLQQVERSMFMMGYMFVVPLVSIFAFV